jgi:single-strand DNA-binding protein
MFGTVVGRVGQIKKAEHVGQGTFLLGFSVAEDKYMGPNKDKLTTWHDCAFFGRRAESVAQYITVGSQIAVNGQAYLEEYEGKKYLKVAVDNVVLLGGGQQQAPAQAPAPPQPPQQPDGPGVFNDDIPF